MYIQYAESYAIFKINSNKQYKIKLKWQIWNRKSSKPLKRLQNFLTKLFYTRNGKGPIYFKKGWFKIERRR